MPGHSIWLGGHLTFDRAETDFWTEKSELLFCIVLPVVAFGVRGVPGRVGKGLALLVIALVYRYAVQVPQRWTIRLGEDSTAPAMLTPFLLGAALSLAVDRIPRRVGIACLGLGVALLLPGNAELELRPRPDDRAASSGLPKAHSTQSTPGPLLAPLRAIRPARRRPTSPIRAAGPAHVARSAGSPGARSLDAGPGGD